MFQNQKSFLHPQRFFVGSAKFLWRFLVGLVKRSQGRHAEIDVIQQNTKIIIIEA